MKYSMYLKHYVCKSPYPYYIVRADEDLTKFYVWSKTKMFNGWLYSEQEVVAMIEANSDSVKIPNARFFEFWYKNPPDTGFL